MILNGKKDHRLEELKKVVDSIINRLESRYNAKLSTLNSQRNQLNQVVFMFKYLLFSLFFWTFYWYICITFPTFHECQLIFAMVSLFQEKSLMDSLLKEIEAQLSSTTHAGLVMQSQALRKMLAEVFKTPLPSIDYNEVTCDFPRWVFLFPFCYCYQAIRIRIGLSQVPFLWSDYRLLLPNFFFVIY